MPASCCCVLEAAEARGNPRPVLPQANIEIDIAAMSVATLHLLVVRLSFSW
jgi:hypothetical protein